MLVLTALALAVILVVIAVLLLRNSKAETSNILDSDGALFFDRDRLCQIEVLPIENLEPLIATMEDRYKKSYEEIPGNSSTPNFTLREGVKFPLNQRKIHFKDMEASFLVFGLRPYIEIIEGQQGQSVKKSVRSKTYSGIFFNVEGQVLHNIWLSNIIELDREKLLSALLRLGTKWRLLLVDWDKNVVVDLRRKRDVEDYLNKP